MILERPRKPSAFKFVIPGIIIGIIVTAAVVGAYHYSGDARFCSSCHSMKFVHGKWGKSNHHQFTCTECHLPDTHLPGKVVYKIRAGLNDLFHETLRDYPPGICLSGEARAIAGGNCARCHTSTISETKMTSKKTDCLACHRYLVHGRGVDNGGIKIEK